MDAWEHQHVFLGEKHSRHERRTWFVVALTAAMMVAEIVAGSIFGSMALVADGWHMSTHAAALCMSALAYRFASRHANDPRFSFGTGKFGELAAFASALILGVVALLIAYESLMRLVAPVPIHFTEAAVVAFIGLAVNFASARLLFDEDHHDDDDERNHDRGQDTNIRAAYMHVLADLLTSVLAIAALLAGWFFGWAWLDPLVGIIGAVVIAHWSLGLLRSAGAVLLDMVPNPRLAALLRERLEVGGDKVSDLHLWRLGPGHMGVSVSIVSDDPLAPAAYKERLAGIEGLSHVTVEVHSCQTRTSGQDRE
jgi:cation diffusion facilitator family transporter